MNMVRGSGRRSAAGRWLVVPAIFIFAACQALGPSGSPVDGATPDASGLVSPSAATSSAASPTASASDTASVAPTSEPGTTPSIPPTAPPTARPTARPTPTPSPFPRLAVDDAVLVLIDDLRVRSAPGLDGPSIATAQRNELMLVASGPVPADGYAWYFVMPFDAGATGWVAASSRSGVPWLERHSLRCPGSPLDGQDVLDLGSFGGLACFGANEIRLVGDIYCALGDGGFPFTGPDWLSATGTCLFDVGGGQTFSVLDGGIAGLGLPMTGRVSVTGHFDDPQAAACRWALGPPAPDPIAAVTNCRAMFVGTSIDPP